MSHSIGLRIVRRCLIGLLIIAILLPTLYYLYYALIIHKFTVVSEGRVYRSAEMPLDELESAIKKYNIRTIIDLRRPGRKTGKEQNSVVNAGVKYFNIHSQQIPTDKVIDNFLAVMNQPGSFPVIIHCEHGEGRAPLFSAIYLIEFECWSNEKARQSTNFINSVLEFGGFGLDTKKGKFLNQYKPRLNKCKNINSDISSKTIPVYPSSGS